MILRAVEIARYKCFPGIRQRLEQFQILVGPNASGKSTFLDSLLFVRDLLREGLHHAVSKRARSIQELTWRMEETGFEFAIELQIPDSLRQQLQGSSYALVRYEVAVGTAQDGSATIAAENVWLVRQDARGAMRSQRSLHELFDSPSQVLSPVIVNRRKHAQGYRKVMSRTPEGRLHIRSETTGWNFPLRVRTDQSGLPMIPDDPERFPVSAWLQRILTDGICFLQLSAPAIRWPTPPDAPRTFQPDGSNVPIVLHHLQRKHKRLLRRWIAHLRTVLPDLERIEVRQREEDRYRYLVAVTRDGKRLPSWLLSDGTLRLFALTLLAYLPQQERIYIIEEPENGIHPRALEAVYQSLSSVYGGQVLCATHSPILLNLARTSELLCFQRTETGAVSIVSGDEHPLLKDWQQNVHIGDLLASGALETAAVGRS